MVVHARMDELTVIGTRAKECLLYLYMSNHLTHNL